MMTGPPFAMYHSFDSEKTDMEVGSPVAGPQKGKGRVKPCTMPGGRVVTAMHVGPYDKVVETDAEMQKWIAAKFPQAQADDMGALPERSRYGEGP